MKPLRSLSSAPLSFLVLFVCLFSSCNKTTDTTTIPVVTTTGIQDITASSASGGGNVTSSGGLSVTARGVCYGTSPAPTVGGQKTSDGKGNGAFSSSMNGLTPNTTYYVRAYAINSQGTGYGSEESFTTLPGEGTVIDVDGNVYHPLTIGSQIWLMENLKVTHNRKGKALQNVTGETEWSQIDKGAYCDYDKDPSNGDTYGHLYNWFAVADTSNICPNGWHIPTDDEWQVLIDFTGGSSVAGGLLKLTGTIEEGNGLWKSPNTGASNLYGFSALPGGHRFPSGYFELKSESAIFWSSTKGTGQAWCREISYKYFSVAKTSSDFRNGYSIRCIKNQ